MRAGHFLLVEGFEGGSGLDGGVTPEEVERLLGGSAAPGAQRHRFCARAQCQRARSRPVAGGERDTDDVRQLADGGWDAVVDVSAYKPAQVRRVLEVLGRGVAHWLYISTVSVYDNPAPRSDESAAVLRVDESIPDGSPDAYG